LQIDRFQMGELAQGSQITIREHLADCNACAGLLKANTPRQDEALNAAESADFAEHVMRQYFRRSRSSNADGKEKAPLADFLRKAFPLFAVAAAAAMLFVVFRSSPVLDDGPATLLKGGGRTTIFHKHRGGVSQLSKHDVVAVGDALRFQINPGKSEHLLIVSLQGDRITAYVPFDGKQSIQLGAGETKLMPNSVILEGNRDELLFEFTSSEPISFSRVKEALSKSLQRARSAPERVELKWFSGQVNRRWIRRQRARK
jgi:hypothetical protein